MTMRLYGARDYQPARDQLYERCRHTSQIYLPYNTQSILDILIIIPLIPRNAACTSSHPADALNRSKFLKRIADRHEINPRRFSTMNFRAAKFRNPIRSWRTGQRISCQICPLMRHATSCLPPTWLFCVQIRALDRKHGQVHLLQGIMRG